MDEQKRYEIVGTVTIGTDEYRDLLQEKFDAQKDKDYYSNKYWEERHKVEELEKQVKSLTAQTEQYAKFVASKGEGDELALFIVKLMGKEI